MGYRADLLILFETPLFLIPYPDSGKFESIIAAG